MKLFLVCCLLFISQITWAQEVKNSYNRLNYHQLQWLEIEHDSSLIIFPKGYERLKDYGLDVFQKAYENLAKKIGYPFLNKINIIIYPSQIHLSESNIGIFDNQLIGLFTNEMKKNRLQIAFEGSYEKFTQDFKIALLELLWEQEIKNKNNYFIKEENEKIPFWYKQGFINYFSNSWTIDTEEEFRTCLLNLNIENWNNLVSMCPTLTGAAFCYFLEMEIRTDACKQIFSLLRKGKTLEEALWVVTKQPYPNLLLSCIDFYKNRFASNLFEPNKMNENASYLSLKQDNVATIYSESKDFSAFIKIKRNQQKVYLKSEITGKSQKLLKSYFPPWLNKYDQFQPHIAWRNDNELFISKIKRNKISILNFNYLGLAGNITTLEGIDGVNRFFVTDNNKWILEAYKNGLSELLIFNPTRLKYHQLTNNINDKKILDFIQSDSIGFLLTYYSNSFKKAGSKNNEVDSSGLYLMKINREGIKIEDEKLFRHDSIFIKWNNAKFISNKIIKTKFDTIYIDNDLNDSFILRNAVVFNKIKLYNSWQKDWERIYSLNDSLTFLNDSLSVNNKNVFSSIFNFKDTRKKKSKRQAIQSLPYQIRLYETKIAVGLDNNFLFSRYQPYQSYLGELTLPDLNALAQIRLNDFFDNYFIKIGYKLPVAENGSTYFFSFKNLKHLIDWHFNFYRSVQSLSVTSEREWKDENGNQYPSAAKIKSIYFEAGISYPLSFASTLKFSSAFRKDKTIFLAHDQYSLRFPNIIQESSINSIIFESKTIPLFSERNNDISFQKGGTFKSINDIIFSFQSSKNILHSSQIEAQYRFSASPFIWAKVALKGGISSGEKKMLFIFGGVDNNLIPQLNDSNNYAQKAPYIFQTLVNPFRGYTQNSISGNKYLLLNIDFYTKTLNLLIKKDTKISFLNNLSFGLFLDNVFASGIEPFHLKQQKHTLFSFGASLKSKLAKYPIRFDIGWPGDFKSQPSLYFSFDF